MAKESVEAYISGQGPEQREILSRLRKIILEAAPEAEESIKWAQPVYEINGPFAYLKAFKTTVNFGFWRGADLNDPAKVLEGTGKKMRHVKITGPQDIDERLLGEFVRQAVAFNVEKGDPTKGD